MAAETLEARVAQLENKVLQVEKQLTAQKGETKNEKRGWRAFVGVFADSPNFDDVERIGKEWRASEPPADNES